MALLGNRSVLHKMVTKFVTGTSLAGDPPNRNKKGALRNWGAQTGLDWDLSAMPQGHTNGWNLPLKSGGMSARNTLLLNTTQTALIVGELPADMDATLALTESFDAYRVALAAAAITTTLSQNISSIGLAYSEASAALTFDMTAAVSATLAAQMDAYLTLTETLDAQLAAAMVSDATLTLSSEAAAFGAAYAEATFLLTTAQNISALATKLMQADLTLQTAETLSLEATTSVDVLAQLTLVASASAYGIGYMASSTVAASETPSAAEIAAEVWAYVSRTLTSGGGGGGGLTVEQEQYLMELWQNAGLDSNNPVTVDKALQKISVGDVNNPAFVINLSGNFKTISTKERAP